MSEAPSNLAPNISFRIEAKDLLAIRLLQSNDDTRYVLKGVHFEIHPDGKVLLIATNGRYMGILKPDVALEDPVETLIEFTVDYPLVRNLPKPLDSQYILVNYDGANVRFISREQTVIHPAIKGLYPKWRDVVPTSDFAPFDLSINARYVSDFHKVSKTLQGVRGEQVILKGHKHVSRPDAGPYSVISVFMPGLVQRKFYGMIMPMEQPECAVPDWVKQPAPAPAPIAADAGLNATTTAVAAEGLKNEIPRRKGGAFFIGTSEKPPKGIGTDFPREPGFSYWIEWGRWYKAPTVDSKKFGPHDYEDGPGSCKCGCHMGDASSSGPVDPFGACPLNPKPPAPLPYPPPIIPLSEKAKNHPVPHPIIPPSYKTTRAQARKERKHVHKHNPRPRKNLERSRSHRHREIRKNLHVRGRARRGHDRKGTKPASTRKAG